MGNNRIAHAKQGLINGSGKEQDCGIFKTIVLSLSCFDLLNLSCTNIP
jgi:hypothetical protein